MNINRGYATSLMQDFENVFKSTTAPLSPSAKKGAAKKEIENA